MRDRRRRRTAAAGIGRLEGYLRWQAELRQNGGAGAGAVSPGRGRPGLTAGERAELAEAHAEERRRLAEGAVAGVSDRWRTSEAGCATRYRGHRRRVLCAAVCAAVALASLAAACLRLLAGAG